MMNDALKRDTQSETIPRLLIDVRDAAKALSICERTLATMTKSGEIPHTRLRGRVLYAPHVLRAWIDGQTQGGGAADCLGEDASENNIDRVLGLQDSNAYASGNE
jgi:hypothetical protein